MMRDAAANGNLAIWIVKQEWRVPVLLVLIAFGSLPGSFHLVE